MRHHFSLSQRKKEKTEIENWIWIFFILPFRWLPHIQKFFFFQGFLFRICWIFMNFSFPLPHFAHFYLVLWNKSSTFHPSVVHNTSSKATFHSPLSHSTLLFLHIILKRFLSRTKDNLLRWYEREKCFLHPTHFYSFWSTTITRMCKYEEVRSVVEKYWIQKQKRAALLGRIFYPFFSLLNQDPNWDREA